MSYKIGEIVRGIVIGIQPYGAFIKLDDVTTGLVHISEVSNGFVKKIEDFIQIDHEYSFYVLEYDDSSKHAKLSFKKINDVDKARRKTSYKKPHFKSLDEYALYFNETLSIVSNDENNIKDVDIDISSEEEIDFDFDDSKLNAYPSTILEKDVLKLQQLSFDDRNSLDYLIVICDMEFDIAEKSLIELFHGLLYERIFFIREYNQESYIYSILKKISGKLFKVAYIAKEDKLDGLAIYRVFKQKFVDEHSDLDYSQYFYFFIGDNATETKTLVNKEGYNSFDEQKFDSLENIISFSSLYVLGFANFEIFNFLSGYRKGILDVSKDKTVIKKLLSVKGDVVKPSCFFDHYMHLLNLSNIRIEIDSPSLTIPHFKDNLKSIREYEGKNLSSVIKCSDYPRIVLKDINSFNLGYLMYILIYTSMVKKEAH